MATSSRVGDQYEISEISRSGAGVHEIPGTGAFVALTDRSNGDARRARSWSYVHQVHGSTVAVLEAPGALLGSPLGRAHAPEALSLVEADGLVSVSREACLGVLGADCALVGLASPEGVIAAAHAGWRGLVAGVLAETVALMQRLGATEVVAVLGPCIHAECYAFGEGDLDTVESVLGPSVRASTSRGEAALDLPAAVGVALARAGARLEASIGGCTACDSRWYSHRARRDVERHALGISRSPERLAS